ncbi:hypothetical protein KRR55_14880 [Paeniglutamicibacter sp. ABSL32-1]|uniref:hypothetical protein n=1 Tax=Paeniglutamicibacter quisquiliarum TaxID=2849498 RepID=UPI001C2DB27F|nr:hypothetical protein [Paeniglutamicibacter quisquiliarum]MBV1780400.1 hypothetical protein [Paeniglutamicibacter quisquiliarum]
MPEELQAAPAVPQVQASAHGPMPGTDPMESVLVIRGEIGAPNLPHLPELPERGVGSDAIGRGAQLLEDLAVDLQPYGWRLAAAPGIDARRAASALRTDLNVLSDAIGAEEAPGTELKIQFPGPATLAANLYLHHGERAVSDHGARRDLAQSLALGAVRHLQSVARMTGAERVTVYIDEPDAGAVLNGTLPTASGYRTLRAVPAAEIRGWWSELADSLHGAGAAAVVIGADAEPGTWTKLATTALEAGADGLGANAASLTVPGWELLAAAVESGSRLWLGCLDAAANPPGVVEAVNAIRRPWRQLGLPDAALGALVLTPAGGLEGLSPARATAVLGRLASYAEALNQVRVDG